MLEVVLLLVVHKEEAVEVVLVQLDKQVIMILL